MNRLIYIVLLLTFPCLIPSVSATWLSPDPLMDKYPHISPYAYCNWNPMKYTDPDGNRIIIVPNGIFEITAQKIGLSIGYVKQVQQDIGLLKQADPIVRDMIVNLEESKYDHVIRFPKNKWNKASPISREAFLNHERQGSFIDYDPNNMETKRGAKRTPRVGLGHELQHSLDIDQGTGSIEKVNDIPLMEIKAINMENKVRQQTGDSKRTEYGEKKIPANLLD